MLVNYWNVIWRSCIVATFRSIYNAMNTLTIVSITDGARISLWDFCVAIIIMGAIMNLFINFTTPTISDRSIMNIGRKRKNKD